MPKPWPRILGSPRFKKPDSDSQTSPQSLAAQVPREMPDEPDCEIIKIKSDEDEKNGDYESSKLCNSLISIEINREQPTPEINTVQFVKQCPMRLQERFSVSSKETVVTPISPSLALQFVPDTSSPGSATHARNIYSNQNVVMVLPVDTAGNVFNAPTLCTLQRIENPNEISRIKQVSAVQKVDRGALNAEIPFLEMRKKILQKNFMNNSADNSCESNARCLIPWIKEESIGDKVPLKKSARLVPLLPKPIRVETSSSMPKQSSRAVGLRDVLEGSLTELLSSKQPKKKYCYVNQTESNCRLRDPKNKILTSGNKKKANSLSKMPSNKLACSDAQECIASASDNSIDKNRASDQSTSKHLLKNESANKVESVDKESGSSFSPTKESTNVPSSSESHQRKIPPLIKITDNVGSSNERKGSISVLQDTPEIVRSAVERDQRISKFQESSDNVNSSENKKQRISKSREWLGSVDFTENKKRSISSQKKLKVDITYPNLTDDSIVLSGSEETIDNNDPLETPERNLSSPLLITELPSSKDDFLPENLVEEFSPVANMDISSCESVDNDSWKAQCVACKEKFADRTELHRHATLAHHDVQIVFCDLCSESFLTYRELQEHRSTHCQDAIPRDEQSFETIPTDEENDFLPSLAKLKKIFSRGNQKATRGGKLPQECRDSGKSSPERTRPPEKRRRGRPKPKPAISNGISINPSKPGLICADSSGVEEKKLQTKNQEIVTEEDFVKDSGTAATGKFETAETKKLTVLLTRLEDPELDKYMEKLATNPVTSFGVKTTINHTNPRRKRGRPRLLPSPSKSLGNRGLGKRGRGRKKQRPMDRVGQKGGGYKKHLMNPEAAISKRNSVNHDSESDGMLSSNQSSKSTLRLRSISHELEANEDCDAASDASISKKFPCINPRKQRIYSSSEESTRCYGVAVECILETDLDEINEEQVRRVDEIVMSSSDGGDCDSTVKVQSTNSKFTAKPPAASGGETEMNRVERETESNSKSTKRSFVFRASPSSFNGSHSSPRKTYLPSKRHSEAATKFAQEWNDAKRNTTKTNDLCSNCKELLSVMKQVTARFEGNNVEKTSVQCPFCDVDFIAMIYLEEHVSGSHLHCENETPCKRSKGFADAKLDCSRKKDLNDKNEIMENDPSTTLEEISTFESTQNYLKDLPSFGFQTELNSRKDTVDVPTKSPPSHRSAKENFSSPTTIRRILETCVSQSPAEGKLTLIGNHSLLECWFCKATFKKRSEYICHMREVHDKLKPTQLEKRSTRSSSNSESFALELEASSNEGIASPAKLDSRDQGTADRDYVLKQLMSDDSSDGFEEVELANIDNTAKEIAVDDQVGASSGKKIIGLFAAHRCTICYKQFNRTQDLLMHGLSHQVGASSGKKIIGLFAAHRCTICYEQFNRTQDLLMHGLSHKDERTQEREAKTSESAVEDSQELFVDPATTVETKDIEEADSANEPKSKIINEERNGGIFASNSEGEASVDFVVIHEPNEEVAAIHSEENATNLKKAANRILVISKKSRNEKKPVATTPQVSQSRDEKRKAFEEVLETEKALANVDESNANDKVPIECGKCNRKFPNQALLNEHLFFLHDDTLKDTVLTDVLTTKETKNRRWRCKACRQNFKLLQGYSRHRYIMHGDESMVHVCENCCKILTTVTMVNVHICTDVASYNCRTCEESFPTGMSLRLHNSEKHVEIDEPNVCEPCKKSFLTKSMLKRHENSSHRFLRPYRPRKRSPVMMATQRDFDRSDEESLKRKIDESDDCAFGNKSDESESGDFKIQARETLNKKDRMNRPMVRNHIGFLSKRRSRSRKRRLAEVFDDTDEKNIVQAFGKRAHREFERSNNTAKYIEENEIHQCSLCQLYCLTSEVLENHKTKVHSDILKVCQLCRKSYADGKLTRHMIDEHISPCETYIQKNDSIWNIRNNMKANDTEAFVKILGMKRFMALWEYHRYTEPRKETSSFDCDACGKNFPSNSMHRFHFFAHHDYVCVLCNIEFKSGKDAAKHKTEEHRSAECYMWFVHRTLREVTATENFREIVDRCFLEMISCDSSEEYESDDFVSDDKLREKLKPTEESAEMFSTDVENTEETDDDENSRLLADSEVKQKQKEKADEEKLIVVVTEEDLEKYNIGTRHPNIWGLASHISSTYEGLTPKDVKQMLESYLET